jgi:outer membrane protein
MTNVNKHQLRRCRSLVHWSLGVVAWDLIGIWVLGFGIFTAGCADDKDVSRYRALLDGPHPATMPSYLPDEPLPLLRALRVANADNEAIGISGENYIQALADKMKSVGTLLPTLSLSPQYSLSHGGGSSFFFGGSSGTATSTGTSAVSFTSAGGVSHDFSIPLSSSLTGSLSNLSSAEAAGLNAQQRALLVLDERETILLTVVQSYYNVLTYEHQVGVYEGTVNFKTEKVRDQEARLKLGAVRPLDVATSESDLASTKVSLTQARADAANARSGLARLMGVSVVRGVLTDAFDPPRAIPPADFWQIRAQQHRQDLLAAGRASEAARRKVDAAIREYLPSVSINFSYFLYNDPASPVNWTSALQGSIPIFSALSIEADVRSAWSVYRQAGLTESQVRRQVRDDVNEASQNVQNSREKIAELEVEVDAAQRAFDLAEREYHLGSESNLDRLTQQDALLTAQLSLVSERFTLKSNYLDLLRASGTLATVLK